MVKYCSSINHETNVSEIWKMAKMFKGKSRQSLSNEDCEGWIEEFMDNHSQPAPCNQIEFQHFERHNDNEF